ncbi:MAG: Na+:solute symporter [Salinivirgaceae bacterium]|nr:Na+:solute symporter [Salinivirgaceae bacterium]MDD4745670.1 Na+:solute symporter [Salinivirgaceae bacterium]MDY0280929.1 sodium:solute symporter family protein [Salinivirgaceae bacterium]
MILTLIDWTIIAVFFFIVLLIGVIASRSAGKNMTEYFLGGRGMPWWLLGVSMVACTFSADTPNLVTDMVRESGVARNWAWWAFLITGMVTVFIYAKLWRRSNVMTDLGFYEIRYSGKPASFLRGFRAVYLGVFFNVLIMASVTLAAIKIGAVMFDLKPLITVLISSIVVVVYTSLGGLKGVIWADFFQYSIATFGAILAAVVALQQPEVGGLSQLISNPAIADKLSFLPDFNDRSVLITLFIIPIAVQWWSVWYPGAEPGGGGYIAQRMISAKDEKNAIGATLFFNFMHYAIRPWPWIIVALASLLIYPDLESIRVQFPNLPENYLRNDIAYPIMLLKLSPGWLGLVIASLIGAYMSTIGTHLNWGASYVVNDFYKRFINKEASEKKLVATARATTIALMLFSGLIALTVMENAGQAFNILLLTGAGSGAIYLLRWFWWRVNAWSEISAMIVSTLNAIILIFVVDDIYLTNTFMDIFTTKLVLSVFITSIVWVLVTYLTKPEDEKILISFSKLIRAGGPGWAKIRKIREMQGEEQETTPWEMPIQILCVFIGCVVVYSALFAIGSFLYANYWQGIILSSFSVVGIIALFKFFNKLNADK